MHGYPNLMWVDSVHWSILTGAIIEREPTNQPTDGRTDKAGCTVAKHANALTNLLA